MLRSLLKNYRMPALLAAGLFLLITGGAAQTFFPIPSLRAVDSFNRNLSRISYLFHNPKHDTSEVRVLIYGQSISEQKWWLEVKHFLQTRYPSAHVEVKNLAIGGFSSDRLKITAAHDISSFYPDLIIFHDYGNEDDYEAIIRTIRSMTIAEVVLQTDHMSSSQSQDWHDKHSNVWLPAICQKYGLALADVRTAWKSYLDNNNLRLRTSSSMACILMNMATT